MLQRLTFAVIPSVLAVASYAGCGRETPAPSGGQPVAESTQSVEPPSADVGDIVVDARLFAEMANIGVIRREFPIKAGMSVGEVEDFVKQQDSLAFDRSKDFEEMYNFSADKRDVRNGSGWMYYWVNGKSLLHCDLVIENGRVKSVWVMPGNEEWLSGVYCRLSGDGDHAIEGRMAKSPSRIEADDQLTAIKSPAEVDRLWLHSQRVTDEGMKCLPAFTNLRRLDFNYPGITDDSLRNLKTLTNLRELDVGTVEVSNAALEHIGGLKSLEELRFWNNKEVTDEGLLHLKSLKNLKVLYLDGTSITAQGLTHLLALPNLQELSLADCSNVGDGAVETLARMPELRGINLLDSGISGSAAKELQRKLPHCRIVGP